MGLIYGHLRLENILVNFDPQIKKYDDFKVVDVKLFGHMT